MYGSQHETSGHTIVIHRNMCVTISSIRGILFRVIIRVVMGEDYRSKIDVRSRNHLNQPTGAI